MYWVQITTSSKLSWKLLFILFGCSSEMDFTRNFFSFNWRQLVKPFHLCKIESLSISIFAYLIDLRHNDEWLVKEIWYGASQSNLFFADWIHLLCSIFVKIRKCIFSAIFQYYIFFCIIKYQNKLRHCDVYWKIKSFANCWQTVS